MKRDDLSGRNIEMNKTWVSVHNSLILFYFNRFYLIHNNRINEMILFKMTECEECKLKLPQINNMMYKNTVPCHLDSGIHKKKRKKKKKQQIFKSKL